MYGISIGVTTFALGLKFKAKFMHIFKLNVLEMMTDKEKITIAIKYQVMYGFSFGIFTFDTGPL